MQLPQRKYTAFDALRLAFQASPVCFPLYVLLRLIDAVMPAAIMALATANFVDTATAILRGTRPHDDIYMPLILLLLVLGALVVVSSAHRLVSTRVGLSLHRRLRPAVIQKHAALDYKHIENANSWELISRVSRDPVKAVADGFEGFVWMMSILVGAGSVLTLIVTQVWWAALVILAFSAPMFWLSMRAGKKNYQAGRDAERFNRRTEYLSEVLTGRDNVDERTLFGYGDRVNGRWREQFEAGRILQLKVSARYFVISKSASIILALIAVLIALTLIRPVVTGELSPGMFMGIVSAVFAMIRNFGFIMSFALENISRAGEYMKDFTAFMALSEAAGALGGPDPEPPEFQTLEFRNVRFQYPSGSRAVLDGLSFTLEHGRHYAFVGTNGAGKTTITKLLTGLYTEYEGEIFVNGQELRTYPVSTLKAMFSVVYQDFAKYYISLKDNITLGDTAGADRAKERVSDMIRSSGLDEMAGQLRNGAETPLGKIKEGGQDISGGQWQRVAIARSLMSRAPVKMLDEPTAALDPISESQVYGEFEKLMRGKTTVFISHRLGSTKLADEILVIDGGRIAERGTHGQLMESNGQYAAMFESQRGWYQ
jgi:ATP-binding cassette subfamily B protein